MIALRVSQFIGDEGMFLKATTAYKRAMVGIKPTHDSQEMAEKARDGSIGFSEKIRFKGVITENGENSTLRNFVDF